MHIAAQNVALRTAPDTTSVMNLVRQRQSGITLSASHPVVQAAQTVEDMAKLAKRTDNGRYQALGLMTAGLTIYNLYRDANRTQLEGPNPKVDAGMGGWTFNVSVGTSQSLHESITKTTTPVASAIEAGRNVSITATGTGADSGDITAIGSRISAPGNITLSAVRDITLAAAIGGHTETTRQRSSSASVGLSFGWGGYQSGLAFNLAVSRSNGWSNGWGTTYYNTEVASGGTLSISSGRNLTLSGAKASGKALVARVGTSGAGDLTIASPIDESHYIARESSAGFNLSVPIYPAGTGAPSLGLNASQLNLLAQYEAVRQQSALSAGVDGFDVTVNGHTHLEGGALTTEGAMAGSRLVTQTLTHEGINNRDIVEGRSWSVGINVGNLGQQGWNLGASSAGYARLDTNERSQTPASVGGVLTVTRPDLQASRVAALKAAERDPLLQRRQQVDAELDQLYWNEPPPCSGCAYPRTADPRAQAPRSADTPSQTALPGTEDPAAMAGGGNAEWQAWWNAVQQLQAERNRLTQRIAVVDAKVYGTAANVSLSPSSLHQPLLHTFDGSRATQELRDGVAVTAAFGKAAYKAAGDAANARQSEASRQCTAGVASACLDASYWGEGGRYRNALHMAIGAMSLGTAGATGNLASSLMLEGMDRAIQRLGITDSGAISLLTNLAVAMAGAAAAGTSGAVTAFNADANNRQLQQEEYDTARRARRRAAELLGVSEAEAEARILRQMQRNLDFDIARADGFRIDVQLVAKMGCAMLKCEYRLNSPDYFDPAVNAQFIPSNLRAYREAVAQKERGITAAQRYERDQLSSILLSVGSVVYGLAESAWVLATGRNFLGEDESRWLGAAGIVTAGVSRSGSKLYQTRHIDKIGEVLVVNSQHLSPRWLDAAGDLTWRNPLTNIIEKVPAGNVVHVDHILPRNAAEGIPGWAVLPKAAQERLLNEAQNLQPMLASANCSKGCRIELPAGQAWQTWLGAPINPQYQQYLSGIQSTVRQNIVDAINRVRQGLPP